jgi:hypothetical protein
MEHLRPKVRNSGARRYPLTTVRTYVRTTARPGKPDVELDGALDRGDLSFAVMLAAEVADDQPGGNGLDTSLRFLALVATKKPRQSWCSSRLNRQLGGAEETYNARINGPSYNRCLGDHRKSRATHVVPARPSRGRLSRSHTRCKTFRRKVRKSIRRNLRIDSQRHAAKPI